MRTTNHKFNPYFIFLFLDKTMNTSFYLKNSLDRDVVKDLYLKKKSIFLIKVKNKKNIILKKNNINIDNNLSLKYNTFFDEFCY